MDKLGKLRGIKYLRTQGAGRGLLTGSEKNQCAEKVRQGGSHQPESLSHPLVL
jgi:hypothetical protein